MPLVRVTPHPLRGSAGNVADLLAGFERGEGERADLSPTGAAAEPPPPPPERVVVLAYSKGMSDLLEFLVAHPEWQERVVCIFSWAGVIGGSPLGDQALAGVSKWPSAPPARYPAHAPRRAAPCLGRVALASPSPPTLPTGVPFRPSVQSRRWCSGSTRSLSTSAR